MSELTDFTDPTPDVTSDERSLLRQAGASEKLHLMCQAQLEEIERADGKTPTRNSVLKEVKKYLREWENLDEESADDFSHLGGSFFSAIWDGDLYRAYSRADYNNQAIMVNVFGVREINNDRPMHADPITV